MSPKEGSEVQVSGDPQDRIGPTGEGVEEEDQEEDGLVVGPVDTGAQEREAEDSPFAEEVAEVAQVRAEVPAPLLPQSPEIDKKVGGRLRRFAGAWESDRWAHSIVGHGLKWRWLARPRLSSMRPQRASPVLVDYVKQMLDKGVVVPFEGLGVQNHLFSRPKKGTDKLRVILNVKHLNTMIPCPSFKMVTPRDIRLHLPQEAWLTSVDPKDAYWHVPIAESYQKYLAFSLPMGGGPNSFAFRAMPFGLSIAPRIFTKLCAVLVRTLKERGVEVFAYLDDWLIIARTEKESRAVTARVTRLLTKVGFVINEEKSHLIPTQKIEWIGWIWDTRNLTLS